MFPAEPRCPDNQRAWESGQTDYRCGHDHCSFCGAHRVYSGDGGYWPCKCGGEQQMRLEGI